ncbi:protein jag [Desulfocurvibacter africanus]|uniref:Jag family protein n=1 Tax=Desulfocurvibacter africanus TaxID=873 RepID=UPI0004164090|nr:protein jag [Desulfocurvibacter africanus]
MSEYKEFTGKSLDDAIKEACDFYALDRGKLEIEIISGGSSGIFGLVGKKKAVVKARPRVAQSLGGKPMPSGRATERTSEPRAERTSEPRAEQRAMPQAEPRVEAQAAVQAEARPAPQSESRPEGRSESRQGRGRRSRHKKAPRPEFKAEDYAPDGESEEAGAEAPAAPAPERQAPRPMRAAPVAPTAAAGSMDMEADLLDDLDEDFSEEIQEVEEKPLDKPELEALLRKTVALLVEPIVGQVQITLTQTPDRVRVRITDTNEEDSGLLIGRDGQTINAVQYLVNRVVSKQWPESVRVQIDTGNYRERQDDKLRKMAYFLAGKAKSSGRAQSTKPLTSYHRRVIHMALQADPSVQTRSKGEGPLKRVLILPARRGGKPGNGNGNGGRGRGRGENGNSEASGSAQE